MESVGAHVRSEPAQKRAPSRRLPKLFLVVALVVSGVLLLDIVSVAWTGERLRGTDWLFLAIYAGFIVIALWRRSLASKLAVALLMGTSALYGFELSMDYVRAEDSRNFAWYVNPPGYTCLLQPRGLVGVTEEGTYSTNSRGLRGPEYPQEPCYRVLCVGGSTTECHYLDDAKTWPSILGERLSARGGNVWVGNAGTSGAILADHITLVENLPEAEEADCWIVLCGINDCGNVLRGTYEEAVGKSWNTAFRYKRPSLRGDLERPLHRNLFAYDALERFRKWIKVIASGRDWVVFQDHRAFWVEERREARAAAAKSHRIPDLEPALAEYERLLLRLIERSREAKKSLILATQPVLYDEVPAPELEAYVYGGRLADGTYLATELLARPIGRFNQRLREVCEREGIPCVDLARELPRSTEAFYDDCHFNEPGARLVAETIARAISDWDLSPTH